MADQIISRDQNRITVLAGITDNAAQEIRMLKVNPATGRLLTSASGGSSITLETNGVANGDQALLNLVNGSNIAIVDDGSGNVYISSTGGSGTPASPDTSVQFNDGGNFGGSSAFTFDKNGPTLHLGVADSEFDIITAPGLVGDESGSSLVIETGNGVGAGSGGTIQAIAGNALGTGLGGDVNFTAGLGGVTSGNGGHVDLTSGNAQGDGNGGDISLLAGNSVGAKTGGNVDLTGGAAASGNEGAALRLAGGSDDINSGGSGDFTGGAGFGSGNGGGFAFSTGQGGDTGDGGDIDMNAGDGGATSGAGGHVELHAGDAQGGNSNGGRVIISAGSAAGTGKNGSWTAIQKNGQYQLDDGVGNRGILNLSPITTNRTYTFQDASGTLYQTGGTDVSLLDGGTGASLGTPAVNRIMFWNNGAATTDWLGIGANLFITGTTIAAVGAGGSIIGTTGVTANRVIRASGTGGVTIQNSLMTIDDTGAITTGSWAGVTIQTIYGGTGLTSYTQGDILYASAANTLAALAKNASATRYLSNTGSSNNPAWAQVDVTNGISGTVPVLNGGTGQTTYTNGQLLIGNTSGNTLAKATLTAGTNIAVTNGASSITLSVPAQINLNPNPPDLTFDGLTATFTAGESLVRGDVVFMANSGKMLKTNASWVATMPGMAITLGTIAAAATGSFGLHGFFQNAALYNLTNGSLVYVNNGSGAATITAPSGSSNVVQPIGVAITPDILYFKPDLTTVLRT